MTESRREKSHSQRLRRKRVTRNSGAASTIDSDDDGTVNENVTTVKWNYDLDGALHNVDFSHPNNIITINADEFNMDFICSTGLSKPFLITDEPSKFDFKMPRAEDFDVDVVKKLVGGDRKVEVIEVHSQGSRQMLLDDYVNYYKTKAENRKELLNLLSLEFSYTALADVVSPPGILRQIDWIDLYWPKALQTLSAETDPTYGPFTFPKIRQYCLMSVKDCYTDFHIDFGGTSVWYHVLKGRKVFWLVEPTERNLELYEQWITNTSASDSRFFGDIVDCCCRVELNAGDTFIIPSGWIHGVYTPVDSLVFGGNFLHSFSIPMQLRVIKSEDKIKVSKKYRYPYYSEMLWYVVNGVVERVTGHSYTLAKSCLKSGKRKDTTSEKCSEAADDGKLEPETNEMQVDCDAPVPSCSKEEGHIQKLEISCIPEEGDSSDPHFNIEYLKKMTKCECDGYYMLLQFLRKKLKTKQRHEVSKKFSDPDQLLDVFAELLQKRTEIDGLPVKCEDIHFEQMFPDDTSLKVDTDVIGALDYGVEVLLDDFTKIDGNDGEPSVTDFSCSDIALNVEVATYHEENLDEKFIPTAVDHSRTGMDRQPLLIGGLEKSDTESLSDVEESGELKKNSCDAGDDAKIKQPVNRTVLDSDDFEVDVVGDDNTPEEREPPVQEKHLVKNSSVKSKSASKHRGVKRKLSTKEKVKIIKPKSRKNDAVSSDRPLIVGGLPPAIMPADAPEVPNPYQYDPKAAVTALGHRQLRAAYRVTRDMAQAPPPTQKFRLHPIRRTTSVTDNSVVSATSDLTGAAAASPAASAAGDKNEKTANVSSVVAPVDASAANLDSTRENNNSNTHESSEEKYAKQGSSRLSPNGVSREQGVRHGLRSNRDKKPVDHPKAATAVEFEYKSPLAHTYVHSAAPSSSFSIKTVVGHLNKSHEDVDVRKKSFEHQHIKDGRKRFDRARPQRFSPPRRLSSEEIWDRRYGRSSDSFRFGRSNETPAFPRRYRRLSHEDRHSKYREFGRYDEPYRDHNLGRSEGHRAFDKKQPTHEPRFDEYRTRERPYPDVWRKLANFDPTVPPPAMKKKQFKDDADRTNNTTFPKSNNVAAADSGGNESKTSCSESWRKLTSNPPPPPPPDMNEKKTGRCEAVDGDKSSSEKAENQRPLNAGGMLAGKKSADFAAEACGPSTSEQLSLATEVAQKGALGGPIADELSDSYRPTPICNLPPRPDSVLGIPPIVFEQDHTVTSILKRPYGSRNGTTATNHVSPKPEEPVKEESSHVISGYGGTNVVSNEAIKNGLENPGAVEEKNKFLSTNDVKKEPLDYVSTANELARLTSEITEEPVHSKSEPRLKKSEFSTILTDPRRAKNLNNQEYSTDNHNFHQVESSSKVEKEEEQSASSLFEDLSSLIAEYDEIDK